MQTNILIVSTIPFFGGGESFIEKILSKISGRLFFIVANQQLFSSLPKENTFKFKYGHRKFLRQLNEVKQLINTLNIDCVILNGVTAIYFAPFIQCEKIIAYNHMTKDSFKNIVIKFLYSFSINFCYLFANVVIHPSKYALNQQIFNKKRAEYIYNGVSILKKNEKTVYELPIRVLFLGRVETFKGVDIIVEAFQRLPEKIATLEIVGEGSYSKVVKRITNRSISYKGFTTRVDDYYRKNDVFITLPTNESFGLTIIEAMNNGLPVISCATGGIPEIIKNGYNGLIIKRDYKSVIDAILKLSNNKELIKYLSQNAYQNTKEKFDYLNTIHQINTILNL